MLASRRQFINKVREFIETPFRHQGRVKGVGIDCAGVPIAAVKELGIKDIRYLNYKRLPDGNKLIAALEEHCDRVFSFAQIKLGDLIVFRITEDPQHIGVYAGDNMIIHSYFNAGKVVEEELTEEWMSKIVDIFRIRELVDG